MFDFVLNYRNGNTYILHNVEYYVAKLVYCIPTSNQANDTICYLFSVHHLIFIGKVSYMPEDM